MNINTLYVFTGVTFALFGLKQYKIIILGGAITALLVGTETGKNFIDPENIKNIGTFLSDNLLTIKNNLKSYKL
jgi:hypothetical protein